MSDADLASWKQVRPVVPLFTLVCPLEFNLPACSTHINSFALQSGERGVICQSHFAHCVTVEALQKLLSLVRCMFNQIVALKPRGSFKYSVSMTFPDDETCLGQLREIRVGCQRAEAHVASRSLCQYFRQHSVWRDHRGRTGHSVHHGSHRGVQERTGLDRNVTHI